MSDIPANDLLPRVAVLEEIAASTKQLLADIRAEIRDIRIELRDMRQRQERDFRLLFGATIIVAIGLAGLIAHTQHWI